MKTKELTLAELVCLIFSGRKAVQKFRPAWKIG